MPSIAKASRLHLLLQPTNAESRILRAIRCPDSGEGIVRALELVETSLDALANTGQLPRANLWLNACSGLLKKCEGLEEEHPTFGVLRRDQSLPVFQVLAHPPTCQLRDDAANKSIEVLGRLIAAAVAMDEALNVTAIDAWATLRRATTRKGKSPDWIRIAEAIPLTKEALDDALTWVTTTGLRTLLEEIHVALARPLVEPSSATSPDTPDRTSDELGVISPQERQLTEPEEGLDENEDPDADPRDKEKPDEKLSRNSPTGWLITQANFSRHTQRFGLIGDRDRLHPQTLRQVCKGLMASYFAGDIITRDRVTLAHISLISGLPATLAMHLPFEPVSYPCLDMVRGELHWNYRLALDHKTDRQLPPRSDAEVIKIAFDADVVDHLRMRLLEEPNAKDLHALFKVGAGDSAKQWLRAYRQFLHTHGDTEHPAYDPRFSRSYGDAYRHVCGSDIIAAFMAQDFQACAMGLLHYSTFPENYLRDCNEKVHKYLGFRNSARKPDAGVKGALISITPAEFCLGWTRLQSSTQVALYALENATTADQLVSAFNNVASHRLVGFVTLAGHRGTKLSRLTWRALYTHRRLIHVHDKDVGDYQSDRVGAPAVIRNRSESSAETVVRQARHCRLLHAPARH